jgi:molybdate transport system substrate-binding protein
MHMPDPAIPESITGISSMATRLVLGDLSDAYRERSGQPVAITAVGGVDAIRRIEAGETFDFAVLAADAIDRLGRAGYLDPSSRVDVVRSGIAVAVAAGARRFDIADEVALKDAVLDARSIGYSTGPSGTYLLRLFERWGIAERIRSHLVQAPPGVAVGTLIARGDVELGFQQSSELMHVAGIDVLGPLPPAIQSFTVFVAATCLASTRPDVAREVLAFLASPAADAAKRRHGLAPAHAAEPRGASAVRGAH